jgi:hypothetical protein
MLVLHVIVSLIMLGFGLWGAAWCWKTEKHVGDQFQVAAGVLTVTVQTIMILWIW